MIDLKLDGFLKIVVLPPTSRGRCVVPGAFDLDEDGVGVVGKQHASDQTKHLRNNKPLNSSKDSPSSRGR